MKQRIIFAVALITCAISAMAADFEVDGICYDVIAPDAVEVAAGSYASGDVVIPSRVSYCGLEFNVTGIGVWAFQEKSDLHSVSIPNTVTYIAEFAFWHTGLTEVTIPESVTSIGEGAFCGSEQMTAIKGKFASADNKVLIANGTLIVMLPNAAVFSYTIPNTVTKIGNNAFASCHNLKWVTIPSTVTAIGGYAFRDCENLQSVTVPNSVKSLDNGVLHNCGNLTQVTLPDGLKSIPYQAFMGCGNLTSITIPNTVTHIGGEAFNSTGLTEVVIPASVKTIDWNAFGGCWNLAKVTLPNGLTTIGDEAFQGCSVLTEITIPDSVENLGDNVFRGCSSLKSVTGANVHCDDTCLIVGNTFMRLFPEANLTSYTIPANVTKINDRAFIGCASLVSVDIPASVTQIGEGVFAECSSLQSIVIPDGVRDLREHTFYGCSSLASVQFPEGLETIGGDAFFGCDALATVTLPESFNPFNEGAPFCRTSGLSAFYGKYATDDHLCLIDGDNMLSAAYAGLTEFTVPEGVKRIGQFCFQHGAGEIQKIYLPSTLESVGWQSFMGLEHLTSITLPNSIKRLDSEAFKWTGLQDITIPASVEYMSNDIFGGSPIVSVALENEDPWSITIDGDPIAGEIKDNGTLYVPVGTKDAYSSHWYWGQFRNIVEGAGTAPNRFAAETTKVTIDEVSMVPVTMINDARVIGMQFDVMLPEGVALAQNDNGRYYLEGSDRFDDHSVTAQEIDGGVRFVVYSPTNTEFAEHDGVLFSLPVIANGDQRETSIVIRNILLSDSRHQEIKMGPVAVNINVQPAFTPGDVNGDGRFTVTDVTLTVAYVLGNDPVNAIREAADVNADGRITVTDVTLVVSYVLGNSPKAPARIKAACAVSEPASAERSEIDLIDNGKAELSISGIDAYTSVQFDILPMEGVKIHGVSLRDAEGGNHTMAISNNADGSVRVLAYSLDNRCFASGAVFQIEIEGTGCIEMAVDGIRLAQMRGNAVDEVSAEGCSAIFDLSGIADSMVDGLAVKVTADGLVVTACEAGVVTIYDTLGRAFSRPLTSGANHIALPKGVYMIGNRKAVVK